MEGMTSFLLFCQTRFVAENVLCFRRGSMSCWEDGASEPAGCSICVYMSSLDLWCDLALEFLCWLLAWWPFKSCGCGSEVSRSYCPGIFVFGFGTCPSFFLHFSRILSFPLWASELVLLVVSVECFFFILMFPFLAHMEAALSLIFYLEAVFI